MAITNAQEPVSEVKSQEVVMQMVTGAWVSQAISVVTRLDVPDLLKVHGPQSALQLTQIHGVKANSNFLERILRACASVGIFTEDASGKFGATILSDALTSDSPVSVKKFTELFGASWWRMWTGLFDAVRTGQNQTKAQLGMEYWDYCKVNPQEMEDFGQAMKSNSLNSIQGVLKKCDFSDVNQVADIGGNLGHLAIEIVKKYSHLNGIVMDLPDQISVAEKHILNEKPDIISRIKFIGGDMFEDVPPANVYIMKNIIHDWDDTRCIKLLKNCHARMMGNGRVICVDAVLPPMGNTDSASAKFLDVAMLVGNPGKERTQEQWETLYNAAGFKITSIKPIHDNFEINIVEGIKVA